MPTISDRECSRCDNKLAVQNKNKDGLCSACQRDLNPHIDKSEKYTEWLKAGKPRIEGRKRPKRDVLHLTRPSTRRIRYTGRHMPDPATVPTSYLVACFKELARRSSEAEELMAVRKMLKLPKALT